MKRIISVTLLVVSLQLSFFSMIFAQRTWNVTAFGAIGDGAYINTTAMQRAIDTCSAGDTVLIPRGVFVSGTLYLRSGITLHVTEGAVLKGSPYFKDYPLNEVRYKNAFTHSSDGTLVMSRAFLFAEDVGGVTVCGKGTIDGSGDAAEFNLGNDSDNPKSRLRPCALLFIHCKNTRVYDLRMINSAYWMQNYIGCDTLHLRGLSIYSHTNYNQDGIDVDARNVLIENCRIDVDDDGICFKSHERSNIVENIIVRNCSIATNCNAIKFGTMSMGGFKNVQISQCTIQRASADHIRHWQQNLQFIEQPITVISGIALESVDGAIIEQVAISDISMKDVQTPIFIVLGNRSRRPVGDTTWRKGQIKNVRIKNITAVSHSKMSSSITAYPGAYVENIQLDNIRISSMGRGTAAEVSGVLPENEKAYPENRMYGLAYPSSGFFIRHVKNLSLNNIKLSVRNADHRPNIFFDDVVDSKIANVNFAVPEGNTSAISIKKSKNIRIIKPVFKSKTNPLVRLSDTDKAELSVTGFIKYKGWLLSL